VRKHLLLTPLLLRLRLLLAGLTSLLLGHNQLTVLPACLGQISGLVQLGLEGNSLQQLEPEALQGLSRLQTLALQDNQLSQLPESLGGWQEKGLQGGAALAVAYGCRTLPRPCIQDQCCCCCNGCVTLH
jgi:Leucine-rich repeat (LRR) protein